MGLLSCQTTPLVIGSLKDVHTHIHTHTHWLPGHLINQVHAGRRQVQGQSKQSSWSGFGRTTISQDKLTKFHFTKGKVINKSTRVILNLLSLLYYNTVDRRTTSRQDKIRWAK